MYHGRNYAPAWGRHLYVGLLLGAAAGAAVLRVALPMSLVNGYSRASFLDGTAFAVAFAAILLLIGRWDARVASTAVLRPLRACGVMCYSLYLTHLPVISGVRRATAWLGLGDDSVGDGASVWVGAAAARVLCALVVGACFYWFVERHFLNTPASRRGATV